MSSSSSSSINNYDESQQKQPSKLRIKVKMSKKRPRSTDPSDAETTEQTSTSGSASDDQVQAEPEEKCVCGVCHEPLHLDGTCMSTSTLSSPSAAVTVKLKLTPMPNELRSPAHMNGRGNDSGNGMLNSTSNGTRNGNGVPPVLSINAAMDDLGSAIVSCANVEKSCCRASTRTGYSPHFHFGCLNIPEGSKLYKNLKEFIKYDIERKRFEDERERKDRESGKSNTKNGNGSRNDKASEDMFGEPEEVLNPFLCPLCDVQGTSKYLFEYFINFRSMKTAYFYNDGEAEDFIQPVGIAQKSGEDVEVNGLAFENGFVQHLISKQLSQAEETNKNAPFRIKTKQKPTEVTMERIKDILKSLPREIEGINDDDSKDNSHGNGADDDDNDGVLFDVSKLDATYLVGQPIRLFCSVTNYYHSGRIIDSRIIEEKDLARLDKKTKQRIYIKQNRGTTPKGKSSESSSPKQRQRQRHRSRIGRNGKRRSSKSKSKSEEFSFVDEENKSDILLDKDIGRTQYLVRFRADIEGRKIPVQQWLFLEEHPILVGVAIIWARFDEQHDPLKTIVPTGSNLSATVASPSKKLKSSPSSPGRMRHPKKARSKFRPVQIFVRTALEMMHVNGVDMNVISTTIASGTRDDDNQATAASAIKKSTLNGSKSNKPLDVIGFLFGPKHRCLRIQLANQIKSVHMLQQSTSLGDYKNKDAHANRIQRSPRNILDGENASEDVTMTIAMAKSTREDISKAADRRKSISEDKAKEVVDNNSETAASLLDTSLRDLFIADFHYPPKKLIQYLKLIKTYDDQLVYATAFACLEEEEMKRVVEGHTN